MKFGFLLRHESDSVLRTFYSLPFTPRVWLCLLITLLVSSVVFYLISYWEKRFAGGDCSFNYELLVAFSAFCQHILPLQANLYSRRIAYLVFIICSYIIHCFYTSNLLSHLVNDKDKDLDLIELANKDYEFVVIQNMNYKTEKELQKIRAALNKSLNNVESKLSSVQVMSITDAVRAMRVSRTVILSDYVSLYPVIKNTFENNEICDLLEVDLFSNVKKYLFTSKDFPLKEEFKIGTLLAKEAGLIKKLLSHPEVELSIDCDVISGTMSMGCVITPMVILLAAYILAVLILFVEKIHYGRNRVWPYIE
ncbi:uncharacterized protein LOC126974329 [Leptidea sinapis]|uniref:uncharacterized protein LOC126974329 n=1 Tax=Leptidea sinapis TaxID=189913 RepID=UPI0021C2A96C|nr:uncharacterized protein LOC126974329 [Leptidea sinapis]